MKDILKVPTQQQSQKGSFKPVVFTLHGMHSS